MINGEMSLIVKNVKAADNGTYECRVIITGGKYVETIISLNVVDPQSKCVCEAVVNTHHPRKFNVLVISTLLSTRTTSHHSCARTGRHSAVSSSTHRTRRR